MPVARGLQCALVLPSVVRCLRTGLTLRRGRDTDCSVPPGGRGGHPSPAPTERSVQFYRTTLFRSWFTALWLELAAPHKGDAAWVAAKGTVP
jgi:hypothetical protein